MKRSDSNAPGASLVRSINAAIHDARPSRTISDERAHKIRKELKKARASLRLLRRRLGKRVYRHENTVLRDASRVVSPLRDSKVQIDLLVALAQRFTAELAPDEVCEIESPLRKDLERSRRRLRPSAPPMQRMVKALRGSLRRLRSAAPAAMDADEARKGLRRIYAAAREAFDAASSHPTAGTLHEWRKKTKYLYNALDVVGRKPAKKVPARLGKRADRLGDLLGEDHDLVVLSSESRHARLPTRVRRKLNRLIAKRRAKLAKKALRLGNKTYADAPKRIIPS